MALSSLKPLRHRNFALIWSAALVSNIGSWMQTVALGVLVTAKTGKPLWTGIVAAAAFVPMGLLAPVGGAMADRFDRRRWLLLTTIGETVFAAALAVLAASHHASPGVVTAVAFLGGMCAAIGFPAYQAMLPDLVERDDLLAAVSLSSAQYNMGRVLGPALAGVVLVAGSYTLAFAVNAASFGAVLAALLLVQLPRSGVRAGRDAGEAPPPVSLAANILEGARAAARTRGARSAILLIAVVALLGSPFIALVPAMAIKALHGHAGGTSVLVTAQGIGAVVGAISVAPLAASVGRYRIIVASLALFPLTVVLYGLAPSLWVSAAAIFVVGATYIGVLSGLNTVVQMTAPPALRGRVLSLYMFSLGTVYPVGALLQGAIGDAVGVRAVEVGGAVLLVAVLGVIVALRRDVVGDLALVDGPAPGDGASPGDSVAAADNATPDDAASREVVAGGSAGPAEGEPARLSSDG